MATRIIQCADCGHDHEVRHPRAKYCPTCRLLRDLLFVADATKKCWLCKSPFAPITRNDALCGDCAVVVHSHGNTDCAYCNSTGPAIGKDIAVCTGCARNPKKRLMLVKGLMAKQGARREQNSVGV